MAGYTPPGINPAKGADIGRLFTGTGLDAAGWQALPIIPNGGGFGNVGEALSAILAGLGQLGVDTSGVHDWTRGFNFAPVAANGSNFGTGFHVAYNSGQAAPVSYSMGAPMVWSDSSLDPLGLGTGAARSLQFFTGAGVLAWPPDDPDHPATYKNYQRKPDSSTTVGGGGVQAVPSATRGQTLMLGSSAAGDGWATTNLEIFNNAGTVRLDWFHQA